MESRRSRKKKEELEPGKAAVVAGGWTILAHPLFLEAMERLVAAVEDEQASSPGAPPKGNAKLLAHLLDLAFVKIPRDPGNAMYRHGGTLTNRRYWFRGKTGGGRYRLFYRYDSRAKIIIYAWVNDEDSLRTYGSKTDAYAVFAKMLDDGSPPNTWDELLKAAGAKSSKKRLEKLAAGAERKQR